MTLEKQKLPTKIIPIAKYIIFLNFIFSPPSFSYILPKNRLLDDFLKLTLLDRPILVA